MKEETLTLDLFSLEKFCEKISQNLDHGNIICLFGELGSGKTTFARSIIKSIYRKNKSQGPRSIKSPSFPILITYEVNNIEIYHYDLYRISKRNDLSEINIFEELNNSITFIEWPEIILDMLKDYNFYSLNLDIVDDDIRIIKHNLIF